MTFEEWEKDMRFGGNSYAERIFADWRAEREKCIGICRLLIDAEKHNLVTLLESAVEAAREFLQGEEG